MKDGSIAVLLKGLCVGGTMLVPGVSGGSMAMILGVYDRLISSVSSFGKHKKENFLFLAFFSLGGGLGILLLAKPLLLLIENYQRPMLYFFIGVVAGSIPAMYKKAEVKKINGWTFFYPAIGIAIVRLFAILPSDMFREQSGNDMIVFLLLILAGFIAAVALVLPGISVSYMLLMLGLYNRTMSAITNFYFPLLIPLGLGLILGVVGTTKILEKMMDQHPKGTYLIILGFILGSVVELLPGLPRGMEWILCIATFTAGVGIISLVLQRGK